MNTNMSRICLILLILYCPATYGTQYYIDPYYLDDETDLFLGTITPLYLPTGNTFSKSCGNSLLSHDGLFSIENFSAGASIDPLRNVILFGEIRNIWLDRPLSSKIGPFGFLINLPFKFILGYSFRLNDFSDIREGPDYQYIYTFELENANDNSQYHFLSIGKEIKNKRYGLSIGYKRRYIHLSGVSDPMYSVVGWTLGMKYIKNSVKIDLSFLHEVNEQIAYGVIGRNILAVGKSEEINYSTSSTGDKYSGKFLMEYTSLPEVEVGAKYLLPFSNIDISALVSIAYIIPKAFLNIAEKEPTFGKTHIFYRTKGIMSYRIGMTIELRKPITFSAGIAYTDDYEYDRSLINLGYGIMLRHDEVSGTVRLKLSHYIHKSINGHSPPGFMAGEVLFGVEYSFDPFSKAMD